jgi:hypothetical protein
MSNKHSSAFLLTPGTLAKVVIIVAILGGLLTTYKTNPSSASVPPPGGDPVAKYYVDNLKGSDTLGNGSETKPYATIKKANLIANESKAPMVQLLVRATNVPYQLVDDFYPKRDNMDFIVWGTGRPMVIGKPTGNLSRFDIQKYSGIRLEGYDFKDVSIKIRGGKGNIIRNNRITMTSLDRFVQRNEGAGISAYIWDLTEPEEYINEELTINNNTVTVVANANSSVPLFAIRIQSARGAKVYSNTFASPNPGSVVSVFDAIDSDFGANKFSVGGNKNPVYKFDHTNTSNTYDGWPF